MKKYFVLLWHTHGYKEFTLISDRYPKNSEIVSASGIAWDDIISYDIC